MTWSLAAAGTDISRFGTSTLISTTGETFLDYDFVQVIDDAFAEWSMHGDIEFQQIQDQGGAAGTGHMADIRIFFGEIPGSTAGYAFYPSAWGSAIGGDILLDTLARFNSDPLLFASVVLHEIGHALGLGHVGEDSIMTPTVKKIGLQADDIDGIIQIYGPQDDHDQPDPPMPDPPITPTITGDDLKNKLAGTVGADVIDGAGGNDTLIGNAGEDILMGRDGKDLLKGGSGNDTLEGGAQNDKLRAGSGDDVLDGGSGNDFLKGGNGADTFIFDDGHGQDTIADFNTGNAAEKIDLSAVSGISTFGDVAGAATQLNGNVRIDTGADSWILLQNVDLHALDASDFLF
ncbi:matrixin family metalloprotease [uncultured Roseovarius sp.]|uniref:matrixin family metalloprotease n=1 Tax=uncultured Roseovarius sp. TaxID=293344 RepID=UPI002616129D|nr:matrixin family metalloprotease [uncultured Roseovarius sp.]